MTHASQTRLWPSIRVANADAMIEWLAAVGFVEHATYRDESDQSVVEHAEWLWPAGGGIMFGSDRPDGLGREVGSSSVYLITDDPDAVVTRALEAGGEVVRAVVDQPYGGRDGMVRDPEGNLWSFGSYQPS